MLGLFCLGSGVTPLITALICEAGGGGVGERPRLDDAGGPRGLGTFSLPRGSTFIDSRAVFSSAEYLVTPLEMSWQRLNPGRNEVTFGQVTRSRAKDCCQPQLTGSVNRHVVSEQPRAARARVAACVSVRSTGPRRLVCPQYGTTEYTNTACNVRCCKGTKGSRWVSQTAPFQLRQSLAPSHPQPPCYYYCTQG